MCGGGGIFNSDKNEQSSAYVTGSETWLDHAATSFANGSGTADDPYQISTAEELALLSLNTYNNGNRDYYYKQTADIGLARYYWYPIGGRDHTLSYGLSTHFCGTYDGNGYTISGMKIGESSSSLSAVGLFGFVGMPGFSGGTVKNVNLTSSDIEIISSSKAINVGGIVGILDGHYPRGNILNCQSRTKILIKSSASYTSPVCVGGIAGKNAGESNSFLNCSFFGDIEVTSGQAECGGIAGEVGGMTAIINDCTVDCSLSAWGGSGQSYGRCGGIAGCITGSSATISRCTISGYFKTSGYSASCGGIASIGGACTISDCQLKDVVLADLYPGVTDGCFVGSSSGGSITNCSFCGSGFKSTTNFAGGSGTVSGCYASYNGTKTYSGGDFSGWSIVDNFNNGLPVQNNLFAIAPGGFTSEQIIEHLSNLGYKSA